MNEIIKTITSFHFPGFYESCYSNSDDFWDEKKELENSLRFELGKKIDVEIEYDNFDQYKIDISEEFLKTYVKKIKDILPYDILDEENFKFEIVNNSTSVLSPKYYNYETDQCQCLIKTNYQTLNSIKNYALNMKGAKKYIEENYTSNESIGYISFLPNNIEHWKETDIEKMKDNMLIALLDMLIVLDDEDNFGDINVDVLNNVYQCEYMGSPKLYYNGKKYTIGDE